VSCFRNSIGDFNVFGWSSANKVIDAPATCLQENITYTVRVDMKRKLSDLTYSSFTQLVRASVIFFHVKSNLTR